ncbi:MAG: HypC/HybG/HupF family hydrogenase formation chaperone [Proteobacteria bacterium]|nr:HypC/HybG/HupF family hydrogenase formation chaperone [Pseudomonadota bacterium]
MCLAAPSRVVSVNGLQAIVECFGQQREVNLMLLDEEIVPGDFLLIQAGGLAFERVETKRAEEALLLMADLLEDGSAARRW